MHSHFKQQLSPSSRFIGPSVLFNDYTAIFFFLTIYWVLTLFPHADHPSSSLFTEIFFMSWPSFLPMWTAPLLLHYKLRSYSCYGPFCLHVDCPSFYCILKSSCYDHPSPHVNHPSSSSLYTGIFLHFMTTLSCHVDLPEYLWGFYLCSPSPCRPNYPKLLWDFSLRSPLSLALHPTLSFSLSLSSLCFPVSCS